MGWKHSISHLESRDNASHVFRIFAPLHVSRTLPVNGLLVVLVAASLLGSAIAVPATPASSDIAENMADVVYRGDGEYSYVDEKRRRMSPRNQLILDQGKLAEIRRSIVLGLGLERIPDPSKVIHDVCSCVIYSCCKAEETREFRRFLG